jgi:hypothetical protein
MKCLVCATIYFLLLLLFWRGVGGVAIPFLHASLIYNDIVEDGVEFDQKQIELTDLKIHKMTKSQ